MFVRGLFYTHAVTLFPDMHHKCTGMLFIGGYAEVVARSATPLKRPNGVENRDT